METKERRIELLEINKEETESEIKDIELTIQQMGILKDTKTSEVRKQINTFIKQLEEEKDINENYKEEIELSISSIRGY